MGSSVSKKIEKKRKRRRILIYEYCICSFALMGTILAVIDILQGLAVWQQFAEWGILIILTIDYFVRLILADNKKVFLRENIFNLVAILPFHSVFRIFRVSRLFKLLSLSIIGAFPRKFFRKINKFINTNGLKNMMIFTALAILLGTCGIMYAENMTFGDALWWAFVTATTVGYGDLSPATSLGRLIAAVLMIFGIGLIGSITSTITSYFLKLDSKSYKEESIELIKKKIDNISNLSDHDIDDICKVLKTLNK
ncbi:MAG: potassium channel family protein [Lachnospiraceae bacterium]|jgi:voltage-gated potassium channel|nr:potassium channel family protein [Lachnospiraceae bacterium]